MVCCTRPRWFHCSEAVGQSNSTPKQSMIWRRKCLGSQNCPEYCQIFVPGRFQFLHREAFKKHYYKYEYTCFFILVCISNHYNSIANTDQSRLENRRKLLNKFCLSLQCKNSRADQTSLSVHNKPAW